MNIELLKVEDWDKYLNLRFQLGMYKDTISYDSFKVKYDMINKQGGNIFVIKSGDIIIATAKILIETKFFDNVGHIEDVIVDSNHICKGFGLKIVKFIIDFCFNKCYKIVCICKQELEYFYKKAGFKKTGNGMTYFYDKQVKKIF